MTTQEIEAISKARLASWSEKCAKTHATPAALICVGHDHASGELHVIIPEDLPTAFVVGLLRRALRDLKT